MIYIKQFENFDYIDPDKVEWYNKNNKKFLQAVSDFTSDDWVKITKDIPKDRDQQASVVLNKLSIEELNNIISDETTDVPSYTGNY